MRPGSDSSPAPIERSLPLYDVQAALGLMALFGLCALAVVVPSVVDVLSTVAIDRPFDAPRFVAVVTGLGLAAIVVAVVSNIIRLARW